MMRGRRRKLVKAMNKISETDAYTPIISLLMIIRFLLRFIDDKRISFVVNSTSRKCIGHIVVDLAAEEDL